MRTATTYIFSYKQGLKKTCCAVVLFFILAPQAAKAQTTVEYRIKAVFLYNFTRFIDWPAAAFDADNSPFVIGLLGTDPFGTYLDETVKGELAGQHPIVVKRYKNIKDVDNCQILFINSDEAEQVKGMLPDLKNKYILTVSDANNFAAAGGIIGFFMEKNKIRMQINTSAAKLASLNISSKLLNVAKILQ